MKKYNKDFYFYKKIDVRKCNKTQKVIIVGALIKLKFKITFSLNTIKLGEIKYFYIYKEEVSFGYDESHYLIHSNLPISPKLFFTSFKDKLK